MYEKTSNPNQVIKIGTNAPDTPASFQGQNAGEKLLTTAKVPTAEIIKTTPGTGGQPPMMTLDNVFKKPGAFQATSRGTARTQATIEAGAGAGSLPKLTPAQAQQVPVARQNLVKAVADGGLIAGDLHGGNIVYIPDGAGGLTGIVVDSDLIGTKAGLQKELAGKQGSDVLNEMADATAKGQEPPFSPLLQHIVSVLETGGVDLSVLNPQLDALSVMNALEQARQNIANAAAAARTAKNAAGGALYGPAL